MPSYFIAASKAEVGAVQEDGLTRYYPAISTLYPQETEAWFQLLARDSYTLSDLFVRVKANTLTGATAIKSRINGADGNQVLSIGASATGAFTDAVNSDSLVSGNLFCTESVTGAGTSITFTIFSYILSTASNTTPILASGEGGSSSQYPLQYSPIDGGRGNSTTAHGTESLAYYLFRVSATLSNLRAYVRSNDTTSTSTVNVRINAADGNQVLSIGAGATGVFEDAANTDSVVSGNNVNLKCSSGGGVLKFLNISVFQVKSNSAGRQVCVSQTPNSTVITDGLTRYTAIEGNLYFGVATTETHTQATARAVFNAKNEYVNVGSNSLNGTTTFRIRKNGGDGNLVVSVGSGVSGQLEDLVNSDSFIATDSLNWKIVTGGSSGSIYLTIIGFELEQPVPPGWQGKISGVTNPAKIMGVDVVNIAKVKGVASA